MTLHLPAELLAEMLTHCRDEHPREACGIMGGHHDTPQWVRQMANVHPDPHRYFRFDEDEQLELYAGLDELGLDAVVIWHSHTASGAVPSGTDRQCALDPAAHYVIVGVGEQVRSWRLDDGRLVEEPVVVMAACGS